MLYVPSAHPGCLAPHLWLTDGSSLYDHFGPGFTLLITEGDEHAAERLAEAATKSNIPLKVLAPTNARLHQRYEARFALIRPDQHVAWRGNDIPADCEALLTHVTGASRKAGTTLGAGASSSAVDGTGIEVPFLPNRRSSWRSLFLSQGVRLSAGLLQGVNNGSNDPSRQCPFCPPTADLSSCMLKALRDIARLDAGKGCSILGN